MKNIIPSCLLALAMFTITSAVNLQTPLYSDYAAASNVSTAALTIAFAAYVVGIMPALLLLGGLSDKLGRRLPIATALILALVATAILICLPSWESLCVARFLLGMSAGLATPAAVAYMTELMGDHNEKIAALTVTSATSLGFGGGALATSISLEVQGQTFAPMSFIVLITIAAMLAVSFVKMPSISSPRSVSLFRLPVFPTGTWPFGVAMALAWSTTGMTIAIVPLSLANLALEEWTGLVVFLAIFVGFLCQPIARSMSNSKAISIGFVLVPLGFIVLLAGIWSKSLILILLGPSITSAASYGFTYLSALAEFSTRSPDNRARATAGLLMYAYIGFSLPVIASGALADVFGLLTAMLIFMASLTIITLLTYFSWRIGSSTPAKSTTKTITAS